MEKNLQYFESGIAYAQNWFEIHANQRMRLINFYIVLLAGSLTLVTSGIGTNRPLQLIMAGATMIVITYVFKALDRRTSFLVKQAEKALREFEVILHTELEISEIRLTELSNGTISLLSYRQSFNLLFILGALIGSSTLAHGVGLLLRHSV